MSSSKRKINENIRSIGKNLIRDSDIEKNLKDEINKDIHSNKKK